ncbi:winged helix-turn-helix domain-containing protein [Streptomyces sp. NPDC046862]|uniref:winged helix-turn-helix domain-containing protein n=1 Tax=Streptomyces sp. NPDC046862 TaxID=3154603 RepID=UPI003452EED4
MTMEPPEVYRAAARSSQAACVRDKELDRSRPVWPQIADELRRRIDAGAYPSGSRFPAVVDLASEFDVAASTIQKAVAALRAEGKLRTVLGQGSFVADQEK